jgi:acetyl esterase/lipase
MLGAFGLALLATPAHAQDDFCHKLTDPTLTGPSPQSVPGTEPFIYKHTATRDLRLHVLRPVGKASGAAVVAYSIGGWMFGRVDGFLPNGQQLAAHGITVIMPDIRNRCRDGVTIIDEVADANAAMRWVHEHAAEFGLDPKRIAAAGGSSGGHIALGTAMFPEIGAGGAGGTPSQPSMLLLFFPCVDPTSPVEQVSAPAIAEYGAELSPLLHQAGGLPPMLVLQGTDDPLYDEVNKFCDKAKSLGDSCEYHEYKGAKHGFLRPGQPFYEAGMADLLEFLQRKGYASPAA